MIKKRHASVDRLKVYSLLHVNLDESSSVALSGKSAHEKVDIYLLNANLLNESLKFNDIEYILLTNDKGILDERLSSLGIDITIQEIDCTLAVTPGVRFFSAHYKIDAFKYLSTLDNQYSILCDVDVVFTSNRAKLDLLGKLIEKNRPLVYDITNQVNYEAHKDICLLDLQMLVENIDIPKWYGGEFIGGSGEFFAKLYIECYALFPKYLSNVNCLDHVGDETVTSAALYKLNCSGLTTVEVGSLLLVQRYWNTSKKLGFQSSFDFYKESLFLHLPADKGFLASHVFISPKNFFSKYLVNRYFSRIGIARRIKKIARCLTIKN